ncbi:uncharacterized protein LOC126881501 [Diabrotica virgifera virgifera]|uniref:Uncharacterized protein n=1 Tax=Diabrotica virgifera virgifera TaxID=50390 RepID=A0ABM5JUY5_DIAVI|nr:uncharacterized protein LOC126881501 [Diabrotica virgifera virgifera]
MPKLLLAIGIAVLTIQIAFINKAYADDMEETIEECVKSLGLPDNYVEKLKSQQLIDDKSPCFTKCVMEKRGLIDGEGKLNVDNAEKDIDSDEKASQKSKEIAKNCVRHITTMSSCEDTLKYNACLSPVWCSDGTLAHRK